MSNYGLCFMIKQKQPEKETITQVELHETKIHFHDGDEENELSNECNGGQVS